MSSINIDPAAAGPRGGKKFIICPVKKGTGAPRNEAKWTTSEFPGSGEVVVVIVYIII